MIKIYLLLKYKRKNNFRDLNKAIAEYKNDATSVIVKNKCGLTGSTRNNHKSNSKARNLDRRRISLINR